MSSLTFISDEGPATFLSPESTTEVSFAHDCTDHRPDTVRVLLEDSYATYPHSNGYLRGGRQVVLGIAGGRPSLVRVDLGDPHADHAIVVRPDQFELAADSTFAYTSWSPEHATTPVPWFDIALHSDTLVTCWGNQLLTADAA